MVSPTEMSYHLHYVQDLNKAITLESLQLLQSGNHLLLCWPEEMTVQSWAWWWHCHWTQSHPAYTPRSLQFPPSERTELHLHGWIVCHAWITVCSHAVSMRFSINSAVKPSAPLIMWERIYQTIVDKISTHWQWIPVKVIYIADMLLMLYSIKYPQSVLHSGSLVAILHMYRTLKLAMASFHSLQLTWHASQVQWVCCIHSQQVHKLRGFHGNWFTIYQHLSRNTVLYDGHTHPLLATEVCTIGGKILQGHSSSTIVKGESQLHWGTGGGRCVYRD